MIDHEMRAQSVGGSEIGAIMGIDTRRDAYSVYLEKTGQLPREDKPNPRQKRGHYFEKGIADLYADITGQQVEWFDTTIRHPDRPWQCATPDAWVLDAAGQRAAIMDSKTAGLGATDDWGETGSDQVPEVVTLQGVWTASCATGYLGRPVDWWDACALVRHLDDVRIYRIHRDPELEAMLLEAVDHFWRHHVIPRVPPRPGGSPATTEALRRLYPRNTQALRCATAEEYPLVEELKRAKAAKRKAEAECTAAENVIKAQIGEADGLLIGKDKLTFKRCADTVGVDWQACARELGLRLELLKPIVERALLDAMVKQSDAGQALIKMAGESGAVAHAPDWWKQTLPQLAAQHQVVTKQGSRRLIVPRAWGAEE